MSVMNFPVLIRILMVLAMTVPPMGAQAYEHWPSKDQLRAHISVHKIEKESEKQSGISTFNWAKAW